MTAVTVMVSRVGRAPGAVRRIRVALMHPVSGVPVVDEHVRVSLPAPGPWPLLADVLVGRGEGDGCAAGLAARHPGALVVAVRCGGKCWLRLGSESLTLESLALTLGRAGARPSAAEPAWGIWASVAHAWLVAGLPVVALSSATVSMPMPMPMPVSGAGSGSVSASAAPSMRLKASRRVQFPARPSHRSSRARTASASADSDRPAEE